MKQNLNILIAASMLLNSGFFIYAMGQRVQGNIVSQTAISTRQKALINVVKHVKSDTCWRSHSKIIYKLGDVLPLPGSSTGKIPTSCIYVPATKQFLDVAYSESELQVQQVFSIREVQNQKSIKENN